MLLKTVAVSTMVATPADSMGIERFVEVGRHIKQTNFGMFIALVAIRTITVVATATAIMAMSVTTAAVAAGAKTVAAMMAATVVAVAAMKAAIIVEGVVKISFAASGAKPIVADVSKSTAGIAGSGHRSMEVLAVAVVVAAGTGGA